MSAPRVVIVDDHALFREGVRSRLAGEVEVAGEAGTVPEAIAVIRKERPDVVLLDVHMPVMDGIEFLEAFVQPPTPPPVVIVLTTSVHARDQARMAKLPVADWVSKPLTRAKVDAILQQHFKRHLPPEEE